MRPGRARWVPALAGCLLLVAGVARADGITVTEPWIAAGPPVVKVNAGYLHLANDGTGPVTLTGAESPRFARIEMHRTEITDGKGSMRRETALDIAPGAALEFSPGGLHLMLFAGTPAPVIGETIPVTLLFADGRRVEVAAAVRAPVAGADAHHEHRH